MPYYKNVVKIKNHFTKGDFKMKKFTSMALAVVMVLASVCVPLLVTAS